MLLLIQYISCLQKTATEEKWADVKNLLITVSLSKEVRKLLSALRGISTQFLTDMIAF